MKKEEKDEISMSLKANEILYKGLKLKYEYDFGSTTELLLFVIEEYPIEADGLIVLLSRNEPLELWCHTCKKEPATQFCTVHGWDEDRMFCNKCAEAHAKKCEDFRDYAALPVVNSPRMGVCCYSGGSIDTERDGVFDVCLLFCFISDSSLLSFHRPAHFQFNHLNTFKSVVIHRFDGDDMQSRFKLGRLPTFLVKHYIGFETVFGIVFKIPYSTTKRMCTKTSLCINTTTRYMA
jgi:hypothetical protein